MDQCRHPIDPGVTPEAHERAREVRSLFDRTNVAGCDSTAGVGRCYDGTGRMMVAALSCRW